MEGVIVPEEQAAEIAERAIRNVSFDYDEFPPEAEFTARALEAASAATREYVAKQRRESHDPQVHHDPQDRRYERNLDLDRLQRYQAEQGFCDREWNQLPPVLKPLTLGVLARKGITGHDAEELFNDSLAELVRERGDTGQAPILSPRVFEEIIPLHSRIVRFRAIDFLRHRSTLKNQPNAGDSFEALTGDPDHPVQFEDPSSNPAAGSSFENIYKECQEALTPAEWELIFALYVAQSATVQDLIQDLGLCARLGVKSGASASTRRRVISEHVEQALEKIRKNLLS